MPASAGPAAIDSHLFIVAPNNSGSTVLRNAISASPAAWSLAREGQHVPGFSGPSTRGTGTRLIWASRPEGLARFAAPDAYDWTRTRRAWHFQARSGGEAPSVLVVSSPPFLFTVDALAEAFEASRFVFLVRNPYAIAEGILRRASEQPIEPGEDIRTLAARHVIACFEQQRRNVEAHRHDGLLLRYEDLCADPDTAAARLSGLMPPLGELDLRAGAPAKGLYDEPLRDMNAQQLAALSPQDIAILNRLFEPAAELLAWFGYERLSHG